MMSCFSKSKHSCKYYTETPECGVSVFYERYFVDKENVFRKIRAGVRTIDTRKGFDGGSGEGRSQLRNTCDGERHTLKFTRCQKPGKVFGGRGKIMRLRGRTERSTTHPASIFAAATPATAFISCFARHVELAAILSEDSKECELVADPS